MTVRRRLMGFAVVPVLVLGLAACATEPEPEAEPTPTVEPTPTETIAEPTLPGSRVPATCEQVLAGVDGFTGGPATAVDAGSLITQAMLDQAGFIFCEVEGSVGGTAVSIRGLVGIDIELPSVDPSSAIAAGDAAWTECRTAEEFNYCMSAVYAGAYAFEFSTIRTGPITPDFPSAMESLIVDLGDRMAAWPAPVAAWVAPEGVLAWAIDCDADVAATDAVVRASLPFSSNPPTFSGSGDGFPFIYVAGARQGLTSCAWYGEGGQPGWVDITIAPGAAWVLEGGAALPGTPIDYPGALAASVNDEFDVVTVWVVIDGSIVAVDLVEGGPVGDQTAVVAAAVRVVDAIVAEFGTP